MTPRFIPVLILALASYATLLASTASAAPKADAATSKADATAAPKADADSAPKADDAVAADPDAAPAGDDAAAKAAPKDSGLVADAEAGSSPVELSGQTYYGVGLRYRAVIVPKFMENLFGDGGRTVVANGFGPEFTIRKNAFEYDFSAWYTSYAMDPTPFKSKTDTAEAWELVESQIKVLYLTADFLWSHDIVPEFAFNYGVGAGFGFVWGDLKRQQAFPGPGANDSTGAGYLPCSGPNDPRSPGRCLPEKHYGYSEPSWANGGSKPVVFPWLVLQTGLRYKPHRNFIARLDAGFGTSGFFLGLGADYGL
ncbi:MAG TPA: hypothetical protein VHW01_27725 [Polyangiaceae bacterium]|nr:hypothetical protein [Polyangiaceae bacterium]